MIRRNQWSNPLTYPQVGELFSQVEQLLRCSDVGRNGSLEFLVEPQRGSTMKHQVDPGCKEFDIFGTEAQVGGIQVAGKDFDFELEVWTFLVEPFEDLKKSKKVW